jgi:hypothetical protein
MILLSRKPRAAPAEELASERDPNAKMRKERSRN